MKQYLTMEGTREEIVEQLERWRDHWAPAHPDHQHTCQEALAAVEAGADDVFAVGTRYLVVED